MPRAWTLAPPVKRKRYTPCAECNEAARFPSDDGTQHSEVRVRWAPWPWKW